MRKFLLLFVALIAAVALAGEFYTVWEWRRPYKGPVFRETDTAWHPDLLPGYESRFVD